MARLRLLALLNQIMIRSSKVGVFLRSSLCLLERPVGFSPAWNACSPPCLQPAWCLPAHHCSGVQACMHTPLGPAGRAAAPGHPTGALQGTCWAALHLLWSARGAAQPGGVRALGLQPLTLHPRASRLTVPLFLLSMQETVLDFAPDHASSWNQFVDIVSSP